MTTSNTNVDLILMGANRVRDICIGIKTNDMSRSRYGNSLHDITVITEEFLKVAEVAFKELVEANVVEPEPDPEGVIPVETFLTDLRSLHEQVVAPTHAFGSVFEWGFR